MKLRHLVAVIFLLALSACPSKQKDGEVSTEPVEGSSSANNEKSAEGGVDEMQEKKGGDDAPAGEPAPAPAPAEPAKE